MSDNNTQIAPQQAFEENLKERIRSDIGNLMPDEVLKQMIEKVLEDAFLKKTQVRTNPNDRFATPQYEEVPCELYKFIKEMLKEAAYKAATEWVEKNGEKILEQVMPVVNQDLEKILFSAILSPLRQPFQDFQDRCASSFRHMDEKVTEMTSPHYR